MQIQILCRHLRPIIIYRVEWDKQSIRLQQKNAAELRQGSNVEFSQSADFRRCSLLATRHATPEILRKPDSSA